MIDKITDHQIKLLARIKKYPMWLESHRVMGLVIMDSVLTSGRVMRDVFEETELEALKRIGLVTTKIISINDKQRVGWEAVNKW